MTAPTRRHLAEVAAVALATAHNWLSNRRTPAGLYVPANVAVAAALIAIARWGGASPTDLGLDPDDLPAGALVGAAASAAVIGVMSAAAMSPRTRPWFADERALAHARSAAAYQAFFRIPVGTALAEELTFRGALLGLSLRRRSWLTSVATTSALFGLWHILPTIDTLPSNPLGRDALEAGRHRHAVATAVVGSAIGGAGLALTRRLSGSILAPTMVHAAVNVTGFVWARRAHGGGAPAPSD